MNNIKVSVIITTYNQESYIKKAIDSVLSQKTDFNFEIIISDDCSTDNTPNIIKEIAQQFPQIMTPVYRKENAGISKNWCEALCMAQGEYVTTLEGDDFWICDDKLQRQMDFMQKNPAYSGVSHKRIMTDDNGKTYSFFSSDFTKSNKRSLQQFAKGITFSYTACLHKNFFKQLSQKQLDLITCNRYIADFQLCLLLLSRGDVFVMPDSLGAYRISGDTKKAQSYTSSSSVLKKLEDAFQVIKSCQEFGFDNFNFNKCYCAWAFMPFVEFVMSKNFSQAFLLLKRLPFKAKLQLPYVWLLYICRMLKFKLGRSK